jgi:hypothetical protein
MQQEEGLIHTQHVSFLRNSLFIIERIILFSFKTSRILNVWPCLLILPWNHFYFDLTITTHIHLTCSFACFGGGGKRIRLQTHFTHEQNIRLQAPSAIHSSQAFAIQSRPTISDLTQLTFLVSWTTVSLVKLATSSSLWHGLLRQCKWSGFVG